MLKVLSGPLHAFALRLSDLGQWLEWEWLWGLGGRLELTADEWYHGKE